MKIMYLIPFNGNLQTLIQYSPILPLLKLGSDIMKTEKNVNIWTFQKNMTS